MENELVVGRVAFNPTQTGTGRRGIMKGALAVIAGASILGMEGCNAQQWIDTALADLPTVIQVVGSIIAMAQGGALAAPVMAQLQNISGQATNDLNTAKDLITKFQANKDKTLLGQIDAALVAAQSDLNQILSAFHISDPTLQTTIAASVGLAITTVVGIQALLPPPPAAPTARLAMAKNNGSNAIKEAFNVIVSKNYPKAVLPIS